MVRFGFSPGGGSSSSGGVGVGSGSSNRQQQQQSRKERIEQAKKEAAAVATDKTRRRNFGFLKNGDKRPSTTTLSKTREHAKELALAWEDPPPQETPTSFHSGQILLPSSSKDEPFDPFGNNAEVLSNHHTFSFSTKRTVTNASLLDDHFAVSASPEPTASTLDTFDTASVGSAYDMEFLPAKSSNHHLFPPTSFSSASKAKKKPVDPYASPKRHGTSMPTMPSNSSMQSSFAKPPTTTPTPTTTTPSTSTAAARRKMRVQMRHSSNHSATSSVADDASFQSSTMGSPPPHESPLKSNRTTTVPGSAGKNRLTAYQRPPNGSFYSTASSIGNNSNQSSSNRSGTEVNLFDSQNPNGGFTFDAFGLDQAQVEKEVNDAMHALAGQGMSGFSLFFNQDTDGEFSSQGWDSPATSRRSSPAPSDSEPEGFVDGFRISPTHNRGVSYSPASSSERSFASPAPPTGRRMEPAHNAMETISTSLRWDDSPKQESDVFGDSLSNPWKEDPWGSDSGADSDFGGTQSEIVTSFFQGQPHTFEASFPETQSDVGMSAYQKSVSFHKDVKSPRRKLVSHFVDEALDGDTLLKEDDLGFGQRTSPRHYAPQPKYGQQQQHQPNQETVNGDPFGLGGDFNSSFADAQEEMFQAEFGFPGPDTDYMNDRSASGALGAPSPSRSIPEDLMQRFDEHDGQTGEFHTLREALHARNVGHHQAPNSIGTEPKLESAVRTKYDGARGSSNAAAADDMDMDGFEASLTQKPKSSYGKLRNSYEAAKSRLSIEKPDTVLSQTKPSPGDAFPSLGVEEKKDEEEGRRGTTNGRTSEWQQWENRANQQTDASQGVAPFRAQPASKWNQTTQGSPHAALAGVEMLTPDIVEARRQEKRKSRVEELRQASQQPSAVLKVASTYDNSVPASQQRANECQAERSSFVSLRERLKPTALSSSKAKSDIGADYMSPFASNIVGRLRQDSPRAVGTSDSKSDSGSSPSLSANLKLKQTASGSPLNGVTMGSPSNTAQASFQPQRGLNVMALSSVPTSPEEGAVVEERKLTYRERRELEMKKEQQEGRAKLESEKSQEPKKDVAALIRQRIAANKQKSAISPNGNNGSLSVTPLRSTLKPVAIPSPAGPLLNIQENKNGHKQPSPTQASEQPRYPLRFESSDSFPKVQVSNPSTDIDDVIEEGAFGGTRLINQWEQRSSPSAGVGGSSQSRNLGFVPSKPQSPHDNAGAAQELGDARFATSNRLEALLSKKKQDPKDFSVSSAASSIPKPVNKPAFEPPEDGAAGKNDVKAMLSGLLGARLNPFASLPAPKKEDDFDAIMELKSFESKHSPDRNASQNPAPPRPPSAVNNGVRLALKDDPKYERYFRMLKVGMPMEVVKHAMQKDGVDPSVMDGDHDLPVGLALKEDPLYTKYFKMLKMGIPLPQVKHSMERDGLNADVMDQDHNLPAAVAEKSVSNEPVQKDTKRRARLHWKTLQKVNLNSLWSRIQKEPEVTNIAFDEDEFEELFQADLTPSLKSPKGIGSTRKKGAAVRVIDAKRANNGGIILARVKMSHDEMADVVDRIDGDALTAEQIENIIEYLPTKEERIQLEKYMLEGGQDAAEKFDGLCECEKFMVSMMTVKHAKRKVNALLFKLQFISCLQSIAEDTHQIDDACDELKHSTRLRQLLGIVLQFGNRLNTAGKSRQNKAGAFTLDSLLKLSQAKAFDKKTTFLHYVVMIVHRNNEILLNFTDDLPTCMRADKIYWDQCLQDLEEVENQLENVRRISLYEARARKHNIRNQKAADDDEDSIGDLELSLEEEVEALRATPTGLFTLSAIKQVSALRDKVESTRKKFVRVLEYFGEDKDSMQPHELFNIFCVFGRDFNKAKEEAFASMKKKLREERKQAGKNQQQKPTNGLMGKPPSVPERKTLRASNLQPNMSKVINDLRSPPKEPQQRPENMRPYTSPQQKSLQLQQSSSVGRSPRTPVTAPLQQAQAFHHGNANGNRGSHSPSTTTTYAYKQHAQHSIIPDGPVMTTTPVRLHPLPSEAMSAAESLRQKARSRGQRVQVGTGRTTPIVSNTSTTTETRSPRSSPKSSPDDADGSQHESTLGSRASMRHRRMQAMKRVNAAKGQARNDWGASSQVSTY